MTRMLHVGTCSVCGTGTIGIRVAASSCSVVGMCDECDAVWLDALLQDGPHFLPQPELPCPRDGSSLRSPPAHWADEVEAGNAGWRSAILGETDAL